MSSWKSEESDIKKEKESGTEKNEETTDKKYEEIYTNETGKNPYRSGNYTKTFLLWKKNQIKTTNLEKKIEETVEEIKENEKKTITRSWKDEVTKQVDENILKFTKDLRKDLRDFIIQIKTEEIKLVNKLKKSEEVGYICILYGRPGIGKSTFIASGVIDGYKVVFYDLTNQGRRLRQFDEIWKSENFLYEPFSEKMENGHFDPSKTFEKLCEYLVYAKNNYDPKTTILCIDGYNEVITDLNSYLRLDILAIGEPKKGRQEDVGYGNWYWRTLRYTQFLSALEDAADAGFRIFLTCQVKDVVQIKTLNGKLRVSKTGERAPNVRDEDLYTADIEAFFRDEYDPEKDKKGPREIEIKVSKVAGINENIILKTPKLKDFLDLQDFSKSKKLIFN